MRRNRAWILVVAAAIAVCATAGAQGSGFGTADEVVVEQARPPRPPLPADTPEDAKVKQKLRDTRVTFTFTEKPVMEALAFLQTQGGINIVLDRMRFEDNPDRTVTLKLTDVRLSTALWLLVEQIDLKWIVRDGVVFISDEEGVRMPPMSLTYDVRDLLRIPRGIHPEAMVDETDKELKELIQFIKDAVNPGMWGPGAGYWMMAGRAHPGMLSVTADPETHVKIHRLIEELRRHRGGKALTCTYLIRDLLLEPGEQWTPAKARDPEILKAQEDLVELVTDLVNPDSWGRRESGAYYWARANFGILVVNHDLKTQSEVEDVLKRLRGNTAHLKTSTYMITELLLEPGEEWTGKRDRELRAMQDDLVKLIRDTVEPDSWTKDSGCTVRAGKGTITVTQTPLALEKVTQLLDALRNQKEREREKKATPANEEKP